MAKPKKAVLAPLCTEFGLSADRYDDFSAFGIAVVEFARAHNKDLYALINQQPVRLREFLTFIGKQSEAHRKETLTILLKFNLYLGQQWWKIPCGDFCNSCDLKFWRSMGNFLDAETQYREALTELLGQDRFVLCRLYQLYKGHQNRDNLAKYLEMARKLKTEYQAPFAKRLQIVQDCAAAPYVCSAIDLFPLGANFLGFTKWGSGNHSSADANVRWRFLKHVCGICEIQIVDDVETESAPMPDEWQHWWTILGIDLRWAAVGGEIGRHILDNVELNRIQAMFTGPNQSLPPVNVRAFIETDMLVKAPALLGQMVSGYEQAYKTYAINQSVTAQLVYIEMVRHRIFVSCFNNAVFITARLEEGELTISSCYVCLDLPRKKREIQARSLWKIVG